MSMILSPNDSLLKSLKYKIGDKFFLKRDSLTRKNYSKNMQSTLSSDKVIVQVTSFEINHIGEAGYRLEFLNSELTWRWFVTEDILDEDFMYLGKEGSAARFVMLDE